ncbi:ABC transporter permease [Microvirga roseola]|uniref:ABC transporter permease n=1 Tax=Microvirga roseola TaxID=2883126 RepID=UPI001E32767C|nr:FtsX-like permease family protein [Microvirga roseola]
MLAFRLARTEFLAGMAGLRLFIACIAIGTLMLSAVWMLGSALSGAFEVNGRQIMGGDTEIADLSTPLPQETISALAQFGAISHVTDMRSAARAGDQATPIELRAVDGAHPLYGQLRIEGASMPDALALSGGTYGAVVQATLLGRTGASIGDRLEVGSIQVEIRGTIAAEPDRLGAGGFMIGPRVIVSREALEAADLLTLGSLAEHRYRIRLDESITPDEFRSAVQRLVPGGGNLRFPEDAAGRIRRIVERTSTFLGITGAVALAIALSGAWAAASAWIRKRSRTIALYRLSGAEPHLVAAQHGLILGTAALVGVATGTITAAVLVVYATGFMTEMLPIPVTVAVLTPPALMAAGTMLLGVAGAAFPAVTGSSRISAGAAMRSGETVPRPGSAPVAAGTVLIALAAALAILRLPATGIALKAALWLTVSAVLLALGGWALAWILGRLRPKGFAAASVVRSLSSPRASAAKALSIGIGIAGITVVASLQASVGGVMRSELARELPDLALLDIRAAQLPQIRQAVQASPGLSSLDAYPHLRTIIKSINGTPAPEALVNPRRSRMVRGDIGLSWTQDPIEGNLLAGEWWAPDYSGPMLLSIEEDVADAFGIGPGDRMALSVMGREIEGEVANIREEKDRDFGISFLLVASPNPLRHAPHTWVGMLQGEDGALTSFIRDLGASAPNVTIIDVRQIVREVSTAIEGAMLGILAVAGILLTAGALSLSAVVAADTDARAREALVFSLVGASRREIAVARLLEIASVGALAATIGGTAGLIGGWWLATEAMHIPWEPGLLSFALPLALGILAAGAAGLFAGMGSMPCGCGEIARRLSA